MGGDDGSSTAGMSSKRETPNDLYILKRSLGSENDHHTRILKALQAPCFPFSICAAPVELGTVATRKTCMELVCNLLDGNFGVSDLLRQGKFARFK